MCRHSKPTNSRELWLKYYDILSMSSGVGRSLWNRPRFASMLQRHRWGQALHKILLATAPQKPIVTVPWGTVYMFYIWLAGFASPTHRRYITNISPTYELFNLLLNALRTHISPDRLFTWIRCGRWRRLRSFWWNGYGIRYTIYDIRNISILK